MEKKDLAKLFGLLALSHLEREQAGGDGRSHLSTVYTIFLISELSIDQVSNERKVREREGWKGIEKSSLSARLD